MFIVQRNIPQIVKWRKVKWIGRISPRNRLITHFTEGKIVGRIEVTGIRGRKLKQLLDGLQEKRGYWKLKEKAPDRTLYRTRFRGVYGPVLRHAVERKNK
jgi:hypothetical protein